jgi:CIC family chloride channel protein
MRNNSSLNQAEMNIIGWNNKGNKTEYSPMVAKESVISNSLAVLVGCLTGLAIVIYDHALQSSEILFFGSIYGYPRYYVILLPALGGLIVGVLAHSLIKTRRYDIEEV